MRSRNKKLADRTLLALMLKLESETHVWQRHIFGSPIRFTQYCRNCGTAENATRVLSHYRIGLIQSCGQKPTYTEKVTWVKTLEKLTFIQYPLYMKINQPTLTNILDTLTRVVTNTYLYLYLNTAILAYLYL